MPLDSLTLTGWVNSVAPVALGSTHASSGVCSSHGGHSGARSGAADRALIRCINTAATTKAINSCTLLYMDRTYLRRQVGVHQ